MYIKSRNGISFVKNILISMLFDYSHMPEESAIYHIEHLLFSYPSVY